jgi:hypothetical protein
MKTHIKNIAKRMGAVCSRLFPDALIIGGVALLSYGAWLVYAPAGFLLCGFMLLIGGFMAAKSE